MLKMNQNLWTVVKIFRNAHLTKGPYSTLAQIEGQQKRYSLAASEAASNLAASEASK